MKKKKITLTLTLDFSGKVMEPFIIENVMNSLIHTVNTAGIVDDTEESYTQKIKVVNEKGEGCKVDFDKNFGQVQQLIKTKKK